MPEEEDDDDATSGGDDTDDSSDADTDTAPAQGDATNAVANASDEECDAHKGLLGDALGMLSDQGVDLDSLAQKYGLPHVDVDNLNAGQIAHLTQQLAQEHPEIVQEVAQRYPEAQGLLGYLTGSNPSGGGGMLGGLLGRFGI